MTNSVATTASTTFHSLHEFPYGAVCQEKGVLFSVYSRSATAMRLLLYNSVEDYDPVEIVEFNSERDKVGDIWTLFLPGLTSGQLYHFQASGPFEPELGHRFNSKARLIDPYSKALAGEFLSAEDGICRPPKCVVVDDQFDWQGDRHLKRSLSDTIIYEMHVRGFTQSETSNVEHPGSYLGVIEKIPYLQSLGVTAVELMPVQDFADSHWDGRTEPLSNYWGYDPLSFFAPHRGYASSNEPGAQVREFKEMVRALHAAGIEVILDVVFNHTAEGNEKGPTFGFKGLENSVYYLLEENKTYYKNFSGCGNAINGNHPVVREMIFHCLRYWVLEYHVDGFRFDLASILSRDRDGHLVPNPPVVEYIAEDPFLADTKLIAEAWDAAGAYQVGSFSHVHWAEWNGQYRDDIRKYWNGYDSSVGALATRLSGSSDLFQYNGRSPYHGINFITAHDGFSMNDLVSYEQKHNLANNEGNRDGESYNISINFGYEGLTDDPIVEELRLRQIKNMLATLLLSQGVPMLLAGDECRRTQQGNNNTYCQDNGLSWFDWSLVETNDELLKFCSGLIQIRKNLFTLRQPEFVTGLTPFGCTVPGISWFNAHGKPINWSESYHTLVCVLGGVSKHGGAEISGDLMLITHAGPDPRMVELPEVTLPEKWRLMIDTAADTNNGLFIDGNGPHPDSNQIVMMGRSLRCYIGNLW